LQPAGTDDGDLREGVSLPGMSAVSPRVIYDGWGFIEIEGLGRFRDAKLWPGGGRAWNWRETAPITDQAFSAQMWLSCWTTSPIW
jgi:hypothetical protein